MKNACPHPMIALTPHELLMRRMMTHDPEEPCQFHPKRRADVHVTITSEILRGSDPGFLSLSLCRDCYEGFIDLIHKTYGVF